MRFLLVIAGVLALSLAWAEPVRAQSYKWVDKDGTVHFTDNPYELPPAQRAKVLRELEEERKRNKTPPADSAPEEDDRPVRQKSYTPDDNDSVKRTRESGERLPGGPEVAPLGPEAKKRWQAKARAARLKVEKLKTKCAQLQGAQAQGRRQHLLFGRPGALEKSGKAAEELKVCQEELKTAQKYRDEGLPDRARKAGVPLHWIK